MTNTYTKMDLKRAYERGFDTALHYHGKERVGGSIRLRRTKSDFDASGLSRGQVEVIKMQFERFDATPAEMKRQYKSTLPVMRAIKEGRLHADIPARGSTS